MTEREQTAIAGEVKPVAWPLGSYAPGNYMCRCTCGKTFEGDKRAICCLDCAAIAIKATVEALTAHLDALKEENEVAYREARGLAVAMHRSYYWEVTQWQPLEDLRGVISQIDNMTTGLSLKSERDALLSRVERLEKALKPFAAIAEHDIGDDETDADRYQIMQRHNRAPHLTVGDFRAALKETHP